MIPTTTFRYAAKVLVFTLVILNISVHTSSAQTSASDSTTTTRRLPVIGGYGEASYTYLDKDKKGVFNFDRAVLLVSYRFNDKINLVSEFEMESAGVEAGSETGEFALEQAYLEFIIRKNTRIVAGLFIPRIGYTNEYHLPQEHMSVARPYVEQFIIATTWREMGVSLRGTIEKAGGAEYQLSIMSGLNSEGFESGSGIKGGKQEGREALGNSLALHASLSGYAGPVRLQVSGYLGGSAPFEPADADSLGLESGPFGTPVTLVEANAMFEKNGWQIRVLGSMINIMDAEQINKTFASNVAEQLFGAYAEVAYDLLHKKESKKLFAFLRAEHLDMNMKIPANGIKNDALAQTYFVAGLNYQPAAGVTIKADYTLRNTGEPNRDLLISPFPVLKPYYTQQGIWSLGIGYSF